MSFRQPTSTTIRSFHFRENSYEFPVESMLEPEKARGQLLIEVSTGYLLTTLADTVPQTQQTISYVTQPDGRSIARTTVTLLVSGPSLIDGSVTLHDPLGEVVVLTIMIEPLLFLNSSILTFIRTEANENVFATVAISQRGAQTPVVLSTSDPKRFTLAEDGKDLTFSPVLTLTPSFRGTSIRVRYASNWPGRHTARLVAEAPYATKTVSLRGNSGGLLNWYRSTSWTTRGTQVRQPDTARVRKAGILTILLLGGLACAGYVYKCELMPGLCQPQTALKPAKIALVPAKIIPKPVIPSSDTNLVNTRVPSADMVAQRLKNQPAKATGIVTKADSQVEKQPRSVAPQLVVKTANRGPLRPAYQKKRYYRKYLKRRLRPKRRARLKRRIPPRVNSVNGGSKVALRKS